MLIKFKNDKSEISFVFADSIIRFSEAIQETTIFLSDGSFHKLNVAANTLAQTLIKDEVDIFDLTEIGAA